MKKVVAIALLASVSLYFVLNAQGSTRKNGPVSFAVFDIGTYANGYSITLYDPQKLAAYSGPAKAFGLRTRDIEMMRHGRGVACRYEKTLAHLIAQPSTWPQCKVG